MAMKLALEVVIEAICVVLEESDMKYRQCPLPTDKWIKLVVAEHQVTPGLIWNTGRLTIAIPRDYLDKSIHILRNVWPKDTPRKKGRKRFFLP